MDSDGSIRVVTEGVATLSSDARVIEDDKAGEFLKEFTACLTHPESMLT